MTSPLNKPFQQFVQDMRSLPHDFLIKEGTVNTLSIPNGSVKHVREFRRTSQVIRSDKVNHTPIFHQVVLKRVSCQDDSPSGSNVF